MLSEDRDHGAKARRLGVCAETGDRLKPQSVPGRRGNLILSPVRKQRRQNTSPQADSLGCRARNSSNALGMFCRYADMGSTSPSMSWLPSSRDGARCTFSGRRRPLSLFTRLLASSREDFLPRLQCCRSHSSVLLDALLSL